MAVGGLLGSAVGPPNDWTARLGQQPHHARGNVDPGMVAQPNVDPGYGLHNTPLGNLNQSPGLEVGGWLPAGMTQDDLLRALQMLQTQGA